MAGTSRTAPTHHHRSLTLFFIKLTTTSIIAIITTRGLPSISAFSYRHSSRASLHRTIMTSSSTTVIDFDPSPTIRDKATSTVLLGRRAAISDVIARTDSYVSLFGFRPPPAVMTSMLASIQKGGGSARSHVEVPTVGPASPRDPHVVEPYCDSHVLVGRVVHVTFLDGDGKIVKDSKQIEAAKAAAEGIRLACRLVDTYPEELTTTAFAQECHDLFKDTLTVSIEEIVGEELRDRGYGGIYNVGKAAVHPPRLVILTYEPENDVDTTTTSDSIALVGKGIVYDTGGLAIKSKTGMCGMKSDMGGAAGVLGGFLAAVRLQTPRKIRLLLCLAENAIGPSAVRNDDIITQYSGKTVEINNSDAEGRLVLSDGVAHATKHYDDVGLIVDMATLTGAQLVATGKTHAGILANTLELERRAVDGGLASGDLCFPLLYAPELLKKEFASKVADMKNSVKDRGNAQSSCAGHFIESHIDPKYKGEWLHVDMAGPAWKADRGTGYGVGLVMSLVGAPGYSERGQ